VKAALARVGPYIEALRERVAYVEGELKGGSSAFLCGPSCTYADLFVLPIVLLSARFVEVKDGLTPGTCLPSFYPLTHAWVQTLFARRGRSSHDNENQGGDKDDGGDDSCLWCAKLCKEMLVLHGRPAITQVSPEFGYDCETVHGLVFDPFIRQPAVDLLREHYLSQPGDIFVATYPKAGTTWLQTVVSLLLHKGDASKVSPHPLLQTQCPWLDACFLRGPVPALAGPRPYLDWHALTDLNQANIHPGGVPVEVCDGDALKRGRGSRRRVFKTHAPFHLFPVKLTSTQTKNQNRLHPSTKLVVAVRNVKDVAASLFKHSTSIPAHNYSGNWEHFLELFLAGNVCEGSWFEHTLGWWNAYTGRGHHGDGKDTNSNSNSNSTTAEKHQHGGSGGGEGLGSQLFWMPFEELKADPKFWVTELALFLDLGWTGDASNLSSVVDAVLKASDFEAMALATQKQGGDSAEATSRFANGGKAGGWSTRFSVSQSKRVDEMYAEQVNALTAPGLKFEFGNDPYRPGP